MKHKLIFLPILSILIAFSCKKEDTKINRIHDYDLALFADYTNETGGVPTLEVNLGISSDEINIELDPTVEENPNTGRITFNYSAVTFKKGQKVYAIDTIITERLNPDNCWLIDDENFLKWDFSKSLDIVLVFDVSSSLNQNMETIKSNAKEMINNILNQNPDARIAAVKFSRGNVIEGFTSDVTVLEQFLDANSIFSSPDLGPYPLEGRSETALYEALNTAVMLLENSDARGKGILTFTDGVSNFQFDPDFQTPDLVIANLESADISSYTIGFEGNQGSIDQNAMEDIAINGEASFPENLMELNEVFIRFSNSVAAVYDLTYDTNNAKLAEGVEYRFLFETTLLSE